MKKKKKIVYRCAACSSKRVEQESWSNINTRKHSSFNENGRYWCHRCEDHVDMITMKEE